MIGSNGSGKSTFFNVLRGFLFNEERDGVSINVDREKLKKPVYCVSSEENNPKINMSEISPFDQDSTYKLAYWMERKELSNGQNTFAMLEDIKAIAKEASLVVFDEPEKALDAVSLMDFKNNIKKLSESIQVIIITHHPALIMDSNFASNIVEINPEEPYFENVKKLLNF